MGIIDDVERQRTDVHFDTYTTTWREVLGQFKDDELRIDPEYQRLFRWSVDQQTQYIESLLLGIPSPPLFFAENNDSKFEVIDGLQRVSTLVKLFAKEIFGEVASPGSDENQEEEVNNIRVPSKLAGGPIVPSLEGFTAESLPEALIRTIKYARISVILIEKKSSVRARYEVFRRLNTFGSKLSDQEIRNCTARLLGKEFPAQLRKLANVQTIREALSLTEDAKKAMGVEEALLRLLAFNFGEKPLRHAVGEYLDEFMASASEGKFRLTAQIEEQIQRTFALVNTALPEGDAFRFRRGGFSTNLFDIVATGVFHNESNLSPETIRTKFEALLESPTLKELTGAGSNTRKKLEGRIALGREWFRQ